MRGSGSRGAADIVALPAVEVLAVPQEEALTITLPPVEVLPIPREEPLRVFTLEEGVRIEVLREGDGTTFPTQFLEAHVVGRLQQGCAFEGTQSKGQEALKMVIGHGAVIAGMEFGLPHLSLGTLAELHIPAELGYMHVGVPRMIPPNADLVFEVDVVCVDGKRLPDGVRESRMPPCKRAQAIFSDAKTSFTHPWWLTRVHRPPPTNYHINVCRHLARRVPPETLARARPIPRKTRREAEGWDLTGEPCIITGVQDRWRAKRECDMEWFQENLGERRQFVKWQGPVFTKQECLWENPVWETSVSEYIDYVKAVDQSDPDLQECNAAACPRLYLNGWSAFAKLPWLREYVINPTFIDDVSGDLIAESEELREAFLAALTPSYTAPPDETRQKQIDDEYWELTKLFLSPKGALTRLHYDNGGAHAWLSQVRGRKLFVCFAPSDGPYLHTFAGDEDLQNGSWLDPLDADVLKKWPDYSKATPYVAVVEEGETIVAPQGWWHYAVALNASVTVMRNFFSQGNREEFVRRKDHGLSSAFALTVLKNQAKLKEQPDEVLKEIARKTVAKIRETIFKGGAGAGLPGNVSARPSRRPSPGGAPTVAAASAR